MTSGFTACFNHGFHMAFKNGLTISVQWSSGNYCSRKSFDRSHRDDLKNSITESPDAEIAIWDTHNNWYQFGPNEHDQILGWLSPDDVATWIDAVKSADSMSDLKSKMDKINA